jgi:anaerobic carbon-monoxide dehydrogenase iron sulfur subunit
MTLPDMMRIAFTSWLLMSPLKVSEMRKVYVKEEVCMGCHLCEVYCQLQHAQSADLVKAFKKQSPPLPRLRVEGAGVVSLSVRCQQCEEAPCVQACLIGALTRDAKGVITVDEERCIGCCTCLLVCPVAAMKQDTRNRKVIKCDLCQGEEVPACVANCPNEALVYAEVQDGSFEVECR